MTAFQKKAFKSQELYQKLEARGLTIPQADRGTVFDAIERIGYYRLTGYCIPFIQETAFGTKVFVPGTTIRPILALYEFDTNLRNTCLQALEKIEIAVAASICDYLCIAYDPWWYATPAVYADASMHGKALAKAAKHVGVRIDTQPPWRKPSNPNIFLQAYYEKYPTPVLPPAWMLRECASFGFWSHIFESLNFPDKVEIAKKWQYPNKKHLQPVVFEGWLHSLSVFRNHCSHHTRITNKKLTFPPKKPDNVPAATRLGGANETLRAFLVVTDIFLRKAAPSFDWKKRLHADFETAESNNVAISKATGFSQPWRDDSFWSDWVPSPVPTK